MWNADFGLRVFLEQAWEIGCNSVIFRHGRLVARKSGVQRPDAIAKQVQALAPMSAEEAKREEITGLFRNPLRKLFRR